jgi:hypothetical protein
MKKDDLVKVIRAIVQQELKKELPKALAQVFSGLMNQTHSKVVHDPKTSKPLDSPTHTVAQPEAEDEGVSLKSQLREMFNSGEPVRREQPVQPPKQFTKNTLLNEVLNQTRPFNSQERFAMRAGGGGLAMASPAVAMASAGFQHSQPNTTGVGELMNEEELGFLKNVPGMPGADIPVTSQLPIPSSPPTYEGEEGGSAPLEALGEISALDVAKHIPDDNPLKNILTRDYRQLVRIMDKKK